MNEQYFAFDRIGSSIFFIGIGDNAVLLASESDTGKFRVRKEIRNIEILPKR